MGIFSRSKKYRTTRRRLKGALSDIGAAQEERFAGQTRALTDALSAVERRGGQALGELGKTYGAERRDVRERGQQTFEAGSQDLARRGLGSTTITGGLRRGVGEDVSRQLGRLSGQEAGQRADIFGRLGQQEQGIYGMLANVYGQQAAQGTALGLQGLPAATMTQESGFGAMLSGAVQGASAGFQAGGPWGALAGGVAGGAGGYYS
jgi:hypothetical protein